MYLHVHGQDIAVHNYFWGKNLLYSEKANLELSARLSLNTSTVIKNTHCPPLHTRFNDDWSYLHL